VKFASYILTVKSTANCAITETAPHNTQKQKTVNKTNMLQTERNKHNKCHEDSEWSKEKNYTNSDSDNLPSDCITCPKFSFVVVAHLTDGQCMNGGRNKSKSRSF